MNFTTITSAVTMNIQAITIKNNVKSITYMSAASILIRRNTYVIYFRLNYMRNV